MKTLVLGLGNPILSDDGVGVRVARELEKCVRDPEVTVASSGAAGLGLLDVIDGYQKLIIVDAIQTRDGAPGQLYRLGVSDLAFSRHLSSPHDTNLATALELGNLSGMTLPRDICIFAIEVKDVETFSERCCSAVEDAIPYAVGVVLSELDCGR